MKKTSGTDWERLNAMSDEDIDTSDIPELDDDFFQQAELHLPVKKTSDYPTGCRRSGMVQGAGAGISDPNKQFAKKIYGNSPEPLNHGC